MPWSFSSLTGFEQCPFRHYHTKVLKDVSDPPGPEAQFGTLVHKVLEDRLRSTGPLVGTYACYEPYAAKIVSMVRPGGELHAERKIALTEDLKPTGFFAKDVWFRAVADVTIVNPSACIIGDWKTGKRKPSSEQLELSAAAAAALFPDIDTFHTIFLWLKEKSADVAMFTRHQAEKVWDKFLPRVDRMVQAEKNNDWPAKPSGLCKRYCPVKSCKYHGT